MAVDDLPPLRDVIAAHHLRAEKKLGQNFLLDQNITDKIARHAAQGVDDFSEHTVFEIGPGPGGLTRSLLREGAGNVIAVEFDPRAVAALQGLVDAAGGRLSVIQGDALDADLTALYDGPRMIVANLPYNIATPLLIGWLRQIRTAQDAFSGMVLMFQKEVAQRIVAQPNTKAYGRLSVISQWLCDCKILFDLSPAAFTPPPKVTSSVMRFTPKTLHDGAPDFKAVEAVAAAAFNQRRKMIRSSLKDYAAAIEACALDPSLRAEDLSVQDFIDLAKAHP